MGIALTSFRWLGPLCSMCIVGVAGCGAPASTNREPCTFLTQSAAARISGDAAMTQQGNNLTEPVSGYVACIFADTKDESNSVEVQVKTVLGGVTPAALRAAATYFALGEPVQPFQSFPVAGIGDRALGESTAGVAFVVFAKGDVLVYVGARSALRGVPSLQASVVQLAGQVAAALR